MKISKNFLRTFRYIVGHRFNPYAGHRFRRRRRMSIRAVAWKVNSMIDVNRISFRLTRPSVFIEPSPDEEFRFRLRYYAQLVVTPPRPHWYIPSL